MFKKIIILYMTFVFNLLSLPAIAQELHAVDLQPWKIGAEIFVNSKLFESDFGDIGGGLYATDDPGIDVNTEKGAFTPGNWLRFHPVGQLLFWNGTEWSQQVPNGERIEVIDAHGNIISYSVDGVSSIPATIDKVDSEGAVHTHVDFSIFDASGALGGSIGAYRIELRLFESKPDSDISVSIAPSPVAIVFNRGLEHEKFESAVSAAADLEDNSIFVAETGTLNIQRVKALGSYYQAKLKHLGDNKFELVDVKEIKTKE